MATTVAATVASVVVVAAGDDLNQLQRKRESLLLLYHFTRVQRRKKGSRDNGTSSCMHSPVLSPQLSPPPSPLPSLALFLPILTALFCCVSVMRQKAVLSLLNFSCIRISNVHANVHRSAMHVYPRWQSVF